MSASSMELLVVDRAANVSSWRVPCKGGVFPVGENPIRQFAPAGSNRSSYGGNEITEAFDVTDHFRWFSECAGRNVNEH